MAQTALGAAKIEARKVGLSLVEYQALRKTHKRCSVCKVFKPLSEFCVDRSRADGLSYKCYTCRRVRVCKSHHTKRPGFIHPMKGKKYPTDVAARMGNKKGNGRPKGWNHTLAVRKKISQVLRKRAARGARCWNWKGGRSKRIRGIRFSAEYKQWRYDVFMRDRFTCQTCGDARGGNLRAHHIMPMAKYESLTLDLDNGITLCDVCHRAYHCGVKLTS